MLFENGTVLCSNCRKTIMLEKNIPDVIWKVIKRNELDTLPPMFCSLECAKEYEQNK